ncbi:SusD/RagB family nutrient-binding outer membrane lipoprotein [Draconibacterium halophilum]|uniref:SusD/RagB family nutrient-binding outer membrane lipoprotein n=1 Tax=Draconibacterium halophilum TaxID=2706887 RepID=A0A6C0RA80_9BACT|nr:SusD/RagB family nutrient-binding outer membrane lipoprotein [Draconibacterium halophilum]QIA07300.1 SusD/RagB family nutrient-binding outer membrane lipoprotein [Draconibacterium halophilum]
MKKIFIALLSIVLLGTGCDNIDFGDTNKNVNGPAEVNTAAMLSGAMTNFGDDRGRPYRITPALYTQYLVQYVYNDEMLYADGAGSWSNYYVQELSNVQEVINVLSDPESAASPTVLANGSIENQMAVALIWKSVIFKRVTDLFGNVPYSEGLNPDILTPVYDSQQAIYNGMIADVKAARDMIDASAAGATGDVIYGGDMEMWQKFANSFLVNLGMQLTKADASLAQSTVTEALSSSLGVLESASEDALYTYDVPNGFTNPWNWMRPADYGVAAEFISALKGTGFTSNTMMDDRIEYVTDNTSVPGHAYGLRDYPDTENTAPVATIVIDPATQLPILTSAYTYLQRAEAAARGWTSEDAGEMLKAGIMSSYERGAALYGVEIGDGAAYADARIADMATAGDLTVIAEEKWVDLFPLGYDSWSEWRRTGIPAFTPAADAVNDGQIPRRYNYPNNEPSLNNAGYSSGVSALSPSTDNNTSRFWWDQ